jgi:hypothetical protein
MVDPAYYSTLTECVQRMNEINRQLESGYSAVRAVCGDTP